MKASESMFQRWLPKEIRTHTHTHSAHGRRARQRKLFKESGKQTKQKQNKTVCRQRRCGQSTTDDNIKHLLKVKVFLFSVLLLLLLNAISFYLYFICCRSVFHLPPALFSFNRHERLTTFALNTHTQTDDCIYLKSIGLFWWNLRPGKQNQQLHHYHHHHHIRLTMNMFQLNKVYFQYCWLFLPISPLVIRMRFFPYDFYLFCSHINGHFMVNTTYIWIQLEVLKHSWLRVKIGNL